MMEMNSQGQTGWFMKLEKLLVMKGAGNLCIKKTIGFEHVKCNDGRTFPMEHSNTEVVKIMFLKTMDEIKKKQGNTQI
jgi:hypothetical protein